MRINNKISIEEFWNEFLTLNPDNPRKEIPEAYYFCDNEEDASYPSDERIKQTGIMMTIGFPKFSKMSDFEKNKYKQMVLI